MSAEIHTTFYPAIHNSYIIIRNISLVTDFVNPRISVKFDGVSSEVAKAYACDMYQFFQDYIMAEDDPDKSIADIADDIYTIENFCANDQCLGYSFILETYRRGLGQDQSGVEVNVSFVHDALNAKLYNATFKFTDLDACGVRARRIQYEISNRKIEDACRKLERFQFLNEDLRPTTPSTHTRSYWKRKGDISVRIDEEFHWI
jgi:hypothetical protein